MSHVLTLNAGSSSLKFGLFRVGTGDPEAELTGLVERIGGAAAMKLEQGGETVRIDLSETDAPSHAGALSAALAQIEARCPEARIGAVGHRIVHGGMTFGDPAELTPEVIAHLERLIPFAPLHQPHNLAGVQAALAAFPKARQVGCFDTAFHRGQPFVNDTYGLPKAFYNKGVRRYGFHGLSYDYIAGKLAEDAPDLAQGRVIVAHLGNGASMCAMKGGTSVASTMGFTALDGLPMGTRVGQIDPGVLLYLMQQEGMSADQISDLLYSKSGLLGLSGVSRDMRTLLEDGSAPASAAVDYFCHRIIRETGSLAAALGGLDALVFTGGIGENAAPIRAQVCAGLGWLGLDFDAAANAAGRGRISTETSAVTALVIPTNEELVIARAAAAVTC
ncbi:acetate/propionate family kinase [Mesobacterium pallidum]|uniref:acetate/propionate family kinase n=1 Tax=Mesobacterium pallidum TaxID=2872037 RepID=UPI001EE2DC49|nr:acetate/propionate family kinase [Mesobacterium pallidum]